MSANFIEKLDQIYKKERKKNKVSSDNKKYCMYIPLKVRIYGKINQNYIIRKEQFTKFLYIKNGCRVYFSDVDILMMLLQITEKSTMDRLLENLIDLYNGKRKLYFVEFRKIQYEVCGIEEIDDDQIFKNPQDIDMNFKELIVLMNLILSKDIESQPLWKGKQNFLKHTLSKYISLLRYYYYDDDNAKKYLDEMGYDTSLDIYSNYESRAKRDEANGFFEDFEKFDNSGII